MTDTTLTTIAETLTTVAETLAAAATASGEIAPLAAAHLALSASGRLTDPDDLNAPASRAVLHREMNEKYIRSRLAREGGYAVTQLVPKNKVGTLEVSLWEEDRSKVIALEWSPTPRTETVYAPQPVGIWKDAMGCMILAGIILQGQAYIVRRSMSRRTEWAAKPFAFTGSGFSRIDGEPHSVFSQLVAETSLETEIFAAAKAAKGEGNFCNEGWSSPTPYWNADTHEWVSEEEWLAAVAGNVRLEPYGERWGIPMPPPPPPPSPQDAPAAPAVMRRLAEGNFGDDDDDDPPSGSDGVLASLPPLP